MRALWFASLSLLFAPAAVAEEARWNVHLELGPLFNADQPATVSSANQFATGGMHARAGLEYEFMERVGVELAYGSDFLFQNFTNSSSADQIIVAGARVRPWWNPKGGFLFPRPTGKNAAKLSPLDFLSDGWVDAHVGVSIASAARFVYDVGIGARTPIIWPLQLGLFVRWQQQFGGDDVGSFKQVIFGVTASAGFLPVHGDVDSDGDGVPDSRDRCPDTPKDVRVNFAGCPVGEEHELPAPKCSDTDLDGVCDGEDECPDTKPGAQVDAKGCSPGQRSEQ